MLAPNLTEVFNTEQPTSGPARSTNQGNVTWEPATMAGFIELPQMRGLVIRRRRAGHHGHCRCARGAFYAGTLQMARYTALLPMVARRLFRSAG